MNFSGSLNDLEARSELWSCNADVVGQGNVPIFFLKEIKR